MAPRIPSSPPALPQTPTAAPSATAVPSGRAPDYTVQPKDTLWSIAKRFVETSTGQPATKPQVARALMALKAQNPHLCTPERRNGDLIKPGDPVFFASAESASWGGPPQTAKRPAPPSAQDQAAVAAQNTANAEVRKQETQQALAVMKQVADAVDAQVQAGKPVSSQDAAALSELLGRFSSNPEVINGGDAMRLRQVVESVTGMPFAPAAPVAPAAAQVAAPAAAQVAAPAATPVAPQSVGAQEQAEAQRLAPQLAQMAGKFKAQGMAPPSREQVEELHQLLLDSAANLTLNLSEDYRFLEERFYAVKDNPEAASAPPARDKIRERKALATQIAEEAAAVRKLGKAELTPEKVTEIHQLLLDAADDAELPRLEDFKFLMRRFNAAESKAAEAKAAAAKAGAQPEPADKPSQPGKPAVMPQQQFIEEMVLKKGMEKMDENAKAKLAEARSDG